MKRAVKALDFRKTQAFIIQKALIWLPLVFGLGWLVIRPVGLHFSVMPGNYGDTRLINYILEHFYRWAAGLEPYYWSPRFFYPFPLTLAFSDNLLGAAPFYMLFRMINLDRELALQAWYILGFGLNYVSAAFVLQRMKFHPLAVGCGAFFFTFSLPVLAQIGHLQLLYRFCIPPAFYLLWQFAQSKRLLQLAGMILLALWQVWISIYTGVFLTMLLLAAALLLPFFQPANDDQPKRTGWRQYLTFWPVRISAAWRQNGWSSRLGLVIAAGLFMAGVVMLFSPYIQVTRQYRFARSWPEVMSMLPQPQSYLVADHVAYWQPISRMITGVTMRNEHQLFLGLSVAALMVAGLVHGYKSQQRHQARHALAVVITLVGLTLLIGGFSLYRVIWSIPGMHSIRSVTRLELVWMWPLSIFLAYSIEGLLQRAREKPVLFLLLGVLTAVLLLEPATFTYWQRYSTRHARERLEEIRAQLPENIPENPILFLADKADESEVVSEVDAMLLAQELGWATLNGYSGNHPPGYSPAQSCIELPRRIMHYMRFAGIQDQGFYLDLINRVVPVGFADCDPSWWQVIPSESILDGSTN